MKTVKRILPLLLAVLLLVSALPVYACADTTEITALGGRVIQVDASVQLPYNYASIIGFTVTFRLCTDQTNYEDGYGGVTEDPASPEYNMHFPCYMLVASKGAHGTDEFNKDTFWCAENENYEHYVNQDLAACEITKIGVGAGHYVAGFLDNGKGYPELSGMKAGDTGTVTYQGTSALFEQGDPILTFYGYTAEFEILSIEWITGTPVVAAEEDWSVVEKTTIADVATVENPANQNGCNYVNIITPAEGDGPFPVILWVHGGAWSTSSRTDIILNTTMEYFLAKGYAFVSAEYTLTDRNAPLTEEEQAAVDACEDETQAASLKELYAIKNASLGKQMLYDLKLAVRFLRANGAQYNLDTTFITAMGESAGAHLSLLLSTTNGDAAHEAADPSLMDWKDYSSDVQCAVVYSAPTDLSADSLKFLRDYTDSYPLIASGLDSLEASNLMMATYLMSYDYIVAHTDGVPGAGGAADAELVQAERFMSPFAQVNSGTPPMYLIHGEQDGAVSVLYSYAMELASKQYMDEADVKASYWPDAGHVDKKYFDSYAQYTASFDFVEACRAAYLAANAPAATEAPVAETPAPVPAASAAGHGSAGIVTACLAGGVVLAASAFLLLRKKK